LPIDEASSAEISQIDMKEYFLEKVAENEQKNL
jgi:hypothetical protein